MDRKKISEFSAESDAFVILIKRGSEVVIPRGPTDIAENDVLVRHVPDSEKTAYSYKKDR